METAHNCILCDSHDTEIFFESKLGCAIRSDGSRLDVQSRVRRCVSCGHLFKDRDFVRKHSDYESYEIWSNSSEQDKIDFEAAIPATRSMRIMQYLREQGLLTAQTRVLDYGCNRGAFLKLLQGHEAAGYDVSEQYRPLVEKIGFSYFTPSNPPPKSKFDLLTMIHVFEHLDHLDDAMAAGKTALVPDAPMFAQVPDALMQPTDLYIIDHCNHFFPETLARAMSRIGYEKLCPVERLVSGELTGTFKPKKNSPKTGSFNVAEEHYKTIRSSLERGETTLFELSAQDDKYYVFGAGILGSLVAGALKNRVIGFLDDNQGLHGRTAFGLPVLSLNDPQVKDAKIVVAVPPVAAEKVALKCRQKGHIVYVPFTLER